MVGIIVCVVVVVVGIVVFSVGVVNLLFFHFKELNYTIISILVDFNCTTKTPF